MKWISIKEKLPEHNQIVYTLTDKKMQVVTIFVDNKIIEAILRSKGIDACEQTKQNAYSFCSQEMKHIGAVLNNVTHWMPLMELPNE